MEAVIKLRRMFYTDKSTIGSLQFDEFSCFSLEDTVRKEGEKIYGKTAIPKGKYEIAVNYSNRFGKLLPMLLNVPDFSGVRIHTGNRPEDTEGCILLAYQYDPSMPDQITDSRKAFNDFFDKLMTVIKSSKVYIEIF